MLRRNTFAVACILYAVFLFAFCAPEREAADVAAGSSYDDLVSLFKEFREFQRPMVTDGVPDYTAAAMREQHRGLKEFQKRLVGFDISGWQISQQVDYHIVRAEMNGLDFYHRVIRPWSTDPDFYSTRYFRFGRMPDLPFPADEVNEYQMRLRALPQILEQAQSNISDGKPDMAKLAIRSIDDESIFLRDLPARLAEHHPGLVSDAERAWAAVQDYRDWLEQNIGSMTTPVGVGIENYNWWLKNVWLFPFTWEEAWAVCQREYERGIATLKLEEFRNRKLQRLEPVENEPQFNQRWKQAEDYLLRWFREEEFFTVPDYLVTIGPQPFETWTTNPGRLGPRREFFENTGDRDPLQEIIHNTTGHNFDGLRYRNWDHPIRGVRRLFGMSRVRSEGWAYGLEEMLMHAGIYDSRPRGREITDIAVAYRAVRAMADLKLHANEFTYDEAGVFDENASPYRWSVKEGFTMWVHRRNTPRLPGNEMGYLMGKVQLEKLIADRAHQLGKNFNFIEFFDELFSKGMIPFALIRWEMTGLTDEIEKLW